MIDHYRALGLARSADGAAIRAAYLSAMRRHHPDHNGSPGAAEQAKLISVAYATLGDPQRRAAYDLQLESQTALLSSVSHGRPARGRGVFLVMVALAIGLSVAVGMRLPTAPFGLSSPGQAIGRTAAKEPKPVGDACATAIDPGAIRKAVFATVGEIQPRQRAAVDLAAERAGVRLTGVSQEGSALLGNLRCQATLLIQLPGGVTTEQGSRTMVTGVSYAPRTGKAVATLRLEADARLSSTLQKLTTATLAEKVNLPSVLIGRTDAAPLPSPKRMQIIAAEAPAQTTAFVPPVMTPRPSSTPRPTPALTGIDLAALERHQTLLYNQSYLQADERRRALLLESRASFVQQLARCTSDDCRRDAYLRSNQQIVAIIRN